MSRRAALRERRKRREQRRRLNWILIIVGVALVVTAVLILPTLRPVGEITVPPLRPRGMADGRALGDPNAPVRIEVFEDFQCAACKNFSDTIEPLIEETFVESGQAYYVFLHFPFLDDRAAGNESNQSANASMCAADQGMFWEYHDILFANLQGVNQGSFSDKRLVAFAEKIGLDMPAFEDCFSSERFLDQITEDFREGNARAITGTPSVFVNGEQIRPGFVPSFQDISQAVERALAEGGGS